MSVFTRRAERQSTKKWLDRKTQMAIFSKNRGSEKQKTPAIWARPEMQVTFRAEIMPGKSREERTFRISGVLSNNRVTLHEFPDEHRQAEFEPVNFKLNRTK